MKPINEIDMEQLSAYIDGELSDSERRFFQKRLAADAGLREACERAWIASSILKSQPIQLMPASSAEVICDGCGQQTPSRGPWRLVASFAALAVAFGLGVQLLPSGQDDSVPLAQTEKASDRQSVQNGDTNIAQQEAAPVIAVTAKAQVAATDKAPKAASSPNDDPSQFTLNEAAMAKTWPQQDAAMQGYLIRHNQMAGNAAGNDLISYAELLAEPQSSVQAPEQEQK